MNLKALLLNNKFHVFVIYTGTGVVAQKLCELYIKKNPEKFPDFFEKPKEREDELPKFIIPRLPPGRALIEISVGKIV